MTSISTVEQDLVNGVLAVQGGLFENWEDVLTNADKIETFIRDGLDWLEDTSHWTKLEGELKDAVSTLKSDLDSLDASVLGPAVAAAKKEFGQVLDPVLQDYDEFKDDFAQAISKVASKIKALEGDEIPSDIQQAIAVINNLLSPILNSEISFALKDLKPVQNTNGQGNDSPTHQQEAEAINNWYAELDGKFQNFLYRNADTIDSMFSNLVGQTEVEAFQSLETNLMSALTNLENTLTGADHTMKGELSLTLLLDRLEILGAEEFGDIKTIAADVLPILMADLQQLATMVRELLEESLSPKSFLSELYQEITGLDKVPSLLEIFCIALAIPITLVSNASGVPFSLPGNADLPVSTVSSRSAAPTELADTGKASKYTPPSFTGKQRLVADASVQLTSALVLFANKVATEVAKSKGKTVPLSYKLAVGLASATLSALDQGFTYPTHGGFFSGASASNTQWFLKWITVVQVNFVKTITDYMYSKELAEMDDLDSTSKRIDRLGELMDSFYSVYYRNLKSLGKKYHQLWENHLKSLSGYDSVLPIIKIQTTLTNLENEDLKFTTAIKKSELSTALSVINGLSVTDWIIPLDTNLNSTLAQLDPSEVDKKAISEFIKENLDTSADLYIKVIQQDLDELKFKAKAVNDSTSYETKKTEKDKILNQSIPAWTLFNQLLNTTWSTALAAQQKPYDGFEVAYGIISSLPAMADNSMALYYYKNPPSGTAAEHNKSQYENMNFGLGRFFQIIGATRSILKSQQTAELQSAKYNGGGSDSESYQVTANFSYGVTNVSGNSDADCFDLSVAGINITAVAKSLDYKTFTLTLSGRMSTDSNNSIKVMENAFLGPNGDPVKSSKVFIT